MHLPIKPHPNQLRNAARIIATGPLYLEHPKFDGFEVRQTVTRKAAVA